MNIIEKQVQRWEARHGRKGFELAEFDAAANIGHRAQSLRQFNVALKVDGAIVEVLAFSSLRERGLAVAGFDLAGHICDSLVAHIAQAA